MSAAAPLRMPLELTVFYVRVHSGSKTAPKNIRAFGTGRFGTDTRPMTGGIRGSRAVRSHRSNRPCKGSNSAGKRGAQVHYSPEFAGASHGADSLNWRSR